MELDLAFRKDPKECTVRTISSSQILANKVLVKQLIQPSFTDDAQNQALIENKQRNEYIFL